MNAVGNPRVEDHWAVQQTYPLWKELPTDITCNQVLTLLNPLDLSRCSVTCKQWNGFLTSKAVWEPLSRNHFPSMTPGFFKSFQVYQRFYSNLLNGVCSVKTLLGHTSGINSLALGQGVLFSGSNDNTIKIWDLGSNTCTATLEGHMNPVTCLALRGETLFSGSYDNTIKIWDLRDNTCTETLAAHTSAIRSLALGDETLFSGSYDTTIKIWDLKTNTCTATLDEHMAGVSSLALKGATLFSGSWDATIKIWDLGNNTCTATLKQDNNQVVFSLVLADTTLFSGSEAIIEIWNLEGPAHICSAAFEGHGNGVCSLALRDTVLFSGSFDSSIKIWDLKNPTNAYAATLTGQTGGIGSLAVKDTTLISGSGDATIKIRDFAASHDQIFMEIAGVLEGQDQKEAKIAIDRFSKMPFVEKNKIFNELYEIITSELKPDDQGQGCAAFYEVNGQSATNAQRAEAIKNYLGKLPK
jgi:WD40 repeat protein